jgi:peptide/nickel transport system substrate-binding protein
MAHEEKPMDIGSRLRGAMAASGLLAIICVAFTAHAADKTLVWGKPAEITGFDVHVAGTVASWEMYQMVYETLLTADENLKVQPALAESWEQTSPTSYVFKLRSGAKFSNGRPVTAADVAGSLQRIKNPETASYWSAQLGTIARIETPDDQTVKVELETPHPAFLPALAHVSAAILPIQELKAGEFNPAKEMLGSGPFMVKEHKQDESWSLARNPYYLGKSLPVADELEALIIPDDSARVAALRDGRIDFTTFENPDIAKMLSSAANIAVLPLKTTNYFRIDVNALSPKSAFNDQRVRQAMNLALDRDAINNLVFAGTTSVDYPVPAAFGKSACKSTPSYALPRDQRLEKAEVLLKKAGNEHPKVTLLATSSDPVFAMIAQVAQQSLADAGFDVQIQQPPMAEYLKRVFTDGDFDLAISWLAGYTDPSMVIAWWNPKFALWNQAFQQDVPALDNVLDQIKTMQDGPDRDAKLDEACKLIEDGANVLALVSKVDYVAYRSDRVKLKLPARSGSSNTFQYVAEFEPLH